MVQGNKVRLTWKLLYTSQPKVLLGGAFLLPVFYSRYESLELLLAEIIFSLFLLVIAIFDFLIEINHNYYRLNHCLIFKPSLLYQGALVGLRSIDFE